MLSAVLALLGASAAEARPRVHRLRVPPPPAEVLPSSLVVDMTSGTCARAHASRPARCDRRLQPRHGRPRPHDGGRGRGAADRAADGQRGPGRLVVDLAPGRYKLYCSLFAGTPSSHEVFGMVTYIDSEVAAGRRERQSLLPLRPAALAAAWSAGGRAGVVEPVSAQV